MRCHFHNEKFPRTPASAPPTSTCNDFRDLAWCSGFPPVNAGHGRVDSVRCNAVPA